MEKVNTQRAILVSLAMALVFCVTSFLLLFIQAEQIYTQITLLISSFGLLFSIFSLTQYKKPQNNTAINNAPIKIAVHQLRTPLTAIKWLSEMILSSDTKNLSSEQLDFLESILKSSNRMSFSLDAVSKVSNIENGKIPVEYKKCDFKAILDDLLLELQSRFESKSLEVILKIPADFPKIESDHSLIRQVYRSLLINAIEYSHPKDIIEIAISANDSSLKSHVKDHGVGIRQEDQPHIFEEFFRSKQNSQDQAEHLGLGLYISKVVIESLGGKIGFESKINQGSTFFFTIPQKRLKQA